MKYRATTALIAILVLAFTSGGVAGAGIYDDSAHGNGTYGVNRSGAGYDIGDCAHCHDVYDPEICGNNTYGLFLFASNDSPGSQTDNFCFQCHKGTGSAQVGGITNDTYSTNFGGGTATFTTIYDAFNPATGDTPSSHNLADVLDHAVTNIGFSSDTNACLVCHDQHVAQQNYPVTFTGLGGVKTAIRRPIDYPSPGSPTNLWGDESGNNELMSEYTTKYQAPYYAGGTDFEPANDSTWDGSNFPNLKAFCTNNCHGTGNVWSTERGAGLRRIDWSDGHYNDEHGKTNDYINTGLGQTKAPFSDQAANYVLACTDCHETHGSENEWLLRTTVNGTDVNIPGPNKWWYFCAACHKGNQPYSEDWPANQHTAPWNADTDCYNNGICHHHDAGGGMF
ncbi:MAG: hypothetical protein SWE60_23280 [Thermodesulfobacteriota bacterium]|nr:hypothetical protein [Thermodesulfobacteriota bacterium]